MKFTVEKIVFQGNDGYMLKQFNDEKSVVEQFIPENYLDVFCREAGITSDMIEFVGGAE